MKALLALFTIVALLSVAAPLRISAMDLKPRATLQNLPGDARNVVFSSTGKLLAVSAGQTIKVWDWATNKEVASLSGGIGLSFSDDGQSLAYPGQDEYNNDGLMVWDISANKKRVFFAADNVLSPVFAPGGKTIAAAVGSRIKVWDLATGKEALAVPVVHKCSITVIAFVHGAKRMLSADARGTCVLWDASETEYKKLGEFKRDTDDTPIHALAVSGNGARVALSTGGGEIVILEAADLKVAGVMKGHTQNLAVKSVAFAPDNQMLASACSGVEDVEIKLWDAAQLKLYYAFAGHSSGVNSVAFSPDGKWLATGSDDKSAKIWEVAALIVAATPPPPKPKKVAQ